MIPIIAVSLVFGVAYAMVTGTVPRLRRRKKYRMGTRAVQVVLDHVHPPFTTTEYAKRTSMCACSEHACPRCGSDHALTAVSGWFNVYIRCWECDYRYKVGPKRQYTSVHRALEAHDDQRALTQYRARLLEFREYREMLIKRKH